MTDPSKMFSPRTSKVLPKGISSPVLVYGRTLLGARAGTIADLYGAAPVLARVSPLVGSAKASKTLAISGRSGGDLSISAYLQQSLVNRSRDILRGSVSCEVIWKPWATPWGQSLWKPLARERTISVNGIGSLRIKLWPTPTTSDHKSRSASQATLERNARPLREIVFAMWSTLRATDGAKGGPNMSFGAGGSPLPSQVSKIASTSNAPMENGAGSLHPEFAGWELGLTREYLNCAPSAMPSIRGRRPRS